MHVFAVVAYEMNMMKKHQYSLLRGERVGRIEIPSLRYFLKGVVAMRWKLMMMKGPYYCLRELFVG